MSAFLITCLIDLSHISFHNSWNEWVVFVCLLALFDLIGVKVEGILRQAADVEEVYRRVREYEQGMLAS